MKTDEIVKALKEIPLFMDCSPETLRAISKIAIEYNCEKGQMLYHVGDAADNLYVLVNGIVTFKTKSVLNYLNVQQVMGRAMIFGWAAVLSNSPKRVGTAQCLENSKIFAINGRQLLDTLENDPKSGFLVMKQMCAVIANTFAEKSEPGL